MTVSVAGGSPCAAIASRISASSPSRVEAASQTGRVSPKRSAKLAAQRKGGVGDVDVELQVAGYRGVGAPSAAMRAASASLCAATPLNDAIIGRDSEAIRA